MLEDDEWMLDKLKNGFLTKSGWINSNKKNQCIDQDGNFVPWYNYSAIEFISSKLQSNMNVFEFGSGYSTIFYGQRCKSVHSIELSEDWANKIKNLSQKIGLSNIYIKSAYELNFCDIYKNDIDFDIFVIDSYKRMTCLKLANEKSKDSSIIILDNTERKSYAKMVDFMHQSGWKSIEFCGLGPMKYNRSCTTIFYKIKNIFGI